MPPWRWQPSSRSRDCGAKTCSRYSSSVRFVTRKLRSSYTGPSRSPRSTHASTGTTARLWAPSTATASTGSTLASIQKPARPPRESCTPSTPSGISWGRSALDHSPISEVLPLHLDLSNEANRRRTTGGHGTRGLLHHPRHHRPSDLHQPRRLHGRPLHPRLRGRDLRHRRPSLRLRDRAPILARLPDRAVQRAVVRRRHPGDVHPLAHEHDRGDDELADSRLGADGVCGVGAGAMLDYSREPPVACVPRQARGGNPRAGHVPRRRRPQRPARAARVPRDGRGYLQHGG